MDLIPFYTEEFKKRIQAVSDDANRTVEKLMPLTCGQVHDIGGKLIWTPVRMIPNDVEITFNPGGAGFQLPAGRRYFVIEYQKFTVRFIDRAYNCRAVQVQAHSKRHAKKLTRRSEPVRQWLNIIPH